MVGDKRGPPLIVRGSQPAASYTPMAKKQEYCGNPWKGIVMIDSSSSGYNIAYLL